MVRKAAVRDEIQREATAARFEAIPGLDGHQEQVAHEGEHHVLPIQVYILYTCHLIYIYIYYVKLYYNYIILYYIILQYMYIFNMSTSSKDYSHLKLYRA